MKLIGLRFCLALLLVLGWAVASQALQPPTEEQIEQYKKDGSWEERVRNAYAIGNHKMAPELAARANYKLRRLAYQAGGKTAEEVNQVLPAPPSAWQGMPSTGNVKMFVLLIEFSDYPHIAGDDQTAVDSRIFGPEDTGSINYPYESLTAYYNRSSYGLLNLQGATLGWYNAGKRSDVAETDAGREDLIKKAVKNFDDNGHDFSQYDNDGDGDIDYFAVIWTGPHGEWATFWWSYVPDSGFTDSSYTVDGKILGNYSWQWESSSYPSGSFNPLVLIHETGHAIGLPDYYDYDDYENDGVIKGPNGGVGGLDMMDSNLGDHNAFSKFVLDWLTPTVISATGTYPGQILSSSANAADALLIMPNASTSPFGEFFMAQHRKREKNDAEIPTDGLLIWHVDAELNAEGTDYRYDNSSTIHKLLRLMEADGLEEIEQGATRADRQADEGDFYTVGDNFTPFTVPNSNGYNTTTEIQVTNIASAGSDMTCDVAITGIPLSFQRIAAGDSHTVFIQNDGSLWVWGLGHLNGNIPARIGTKSDWNSITAGANYTVAVKADNNLWGWGGNEYGQLGDGTTENKITGPVCISATADWQTVAAGPLLHTIALKTDGSLWSWGSNYGSGKTESDELVHCDDTRNHHTPMPLL
ncbi:MAG: M6 family metalloprotease domain-containing protein [Candidatus Electronema sp. VV]